MVNITYSFIVPHKNSPKWLNRCLNSIPRREDVEIIVVDDNSDPAIINWDNYKFDNKLCIRLIKTIEGGGAGHARNVGLAEATGKWLLFPDADDYYCEGVLDELDKYHYEDYDVIYFNFNYFVEGNDRTCFNKASSFIKKCAEGIISIDYVKYRNNSPWNKMVNADFVRRNSIKFEEIPIANDMWFSLQVGYFSRSSLVINKYLYNYIMYKKSITNSNWNKEKIHYFLENKQKYNGFVSFVNHKNWQRGFIYWCYTIFKMRDVHRGIRILCYYFANIKQIRAAKNKYPNLIKKRISLINLTVPNE